MFKHTFQVLVIMCCLLFLSTTIILAISSLNPSHVKTTAPQAAAVSSLKNQPASDSEVVSKESTPPNPTGSSDKSTPDKSAGNSNPSHNDNPAAVGPGISARTPSAPQSVTISAVGDIMLHQSNLKSAYNSKSKKYDFSGFFEYVKPYLSSSDLTIANFETVTAGSGIGYKSYPLFNSPDSILAALAGSGFDILSTANNHCLDWNVNGLTRTIQKIKENKMINVGSSQNGKDKYVIKKVNGVKIAVLSYSQFYNGHEAKLSSSNKSKYLSILNETQIQNDIKAVKSKGADAIIAVVHWGSEYQRVPNSYQTALSKKMLSWGADIILGSHPHVIQKSEIIKVNGKNKFVIYSMGNFISGYRRTDKAKRANKVFTEDGVIVQLKLEKDPHGGINIQEVNYLPTWIDKYSSKNQTIFKILPLPSQDVNAPYINSQNKSFVRQSYNNTMNLMAKFNKK